MISVRYGEPENKPSNIQKHAVSDERIRDLGIMKPTRYQLRYHHHVLEPTESHKNNIRAFRIGGEAGGRVRCQSIWQWFLKQFRFGVLAKAKRWASEII